MGGVDLVALGQACPVGFHPTHEERCQDADESWGACGFGHATATVPSQVNQDARRRNTATGTRTFASEQNGQQL